MAKRKVESQTGSLIPDHKKSGIDLIPLHAVGKLSMRATTSVHTSSQSKVYTRNYELAKLRES
jgi:hypothetical protein